MAQLTEETPARPPAAAARTPRRNNPERTRQDILQAAVTEFAARGLSGARVDAIAERTRTSKRMIYYYFGNKEGLYLAVLEKLYGDIRATEETLALDELEPREAIERLVRFTYEHHNRNVDFIRLVSIENIHRGEHIARSEAISALNKSVLEAIARLLERGVALGLFRPGIDALDLHMLISSFCFFRVANRHTFSTIYQVDLDAPALFTQHETMICEAVLRYIQA